MIHRRRRRHVCIYLGKLSPAPGFQPAFLTGGRDDRAGIFPSAVLATASVAGTTFNPKFPPFYSRLSHLFSYIGSLECVSLRSHV